MRTPLVDSAMARSATEESQTQSMRRLAESGGPGKEKKLRQACEGFEAMFIQKMWEGMRASLPKEGMMHSREEQFWQGMYDQELGKSLASSGGIGLADMMMGQLSRDVANKNGFTANRKPMEIEPAPLLPPTQETPRRTAASSAKADAVAEAAAKKGVEGTSGKKEEGTPQNPAQSALADLYSGIAAQPEASGGTGAVAPAGTMGVAGAPGVADGVQGSGTQGSVPNPTPPEIAAYLKDFAVQANAMPTQPQQIPGSMPLQTQVSQSNGAVMPMQMRAPVQSNYPQVPNTSAGLTSAVAQTPASAPTGAMPSGTMPAGTVPTGTPTIQPLQNGQPAQPMPLMQSAMSGQNPTGQAVQSREGVQPPSFVRVTTNIPPSKLRATTRPTRRNTRQTVNQVENQASMQTAQTQQSRQTQTTNVMPGVGSMTNTSTGPQSLPLTQAANAQLPGGVPLNPGLSPFQVPMSGLLGQPFGAPVSGVNGTGTATPMNIGSNVASPMASPSGNGTPEGLVGATPMTVGMNANPAESLTGQPQSNTRRR